MNYTQFKSPVIGVKERALVWKRMRIIIYDKNELLAGRNTSVCFIQAKSDTGIMVIKRKSLPYPEDFRSLWKTFMECRRHTLFLCPLFRFWEEFLLSGFRSRRLQFRNRHH